MVSVIADAVQSSRVGSSPKILTSWNSKAQTGSLNPRHSLASPRTTPVEIPCFSQMLDHPMHGPTIATHFPKHSFLVWIVVCAFAQITLQPNRLFLDRPT